MIIGIPVYDQVDMLDVTGPFEMFDGAGFEVDLLAEKTGMRRFRSKGFAFEVTKSFADARDYDAIWVPGGDLDALATIIDDPKRTYLNFLIAQAARTPMVCSVCEGAMLLAAAGLLDGYHATTHWAFVPCFAERFPKVIVAEGHPRFVLDRSRLTGGGNFIWSRRSVDAYPAIPWNCRRARSSAEHPILSCPAGQQLHPARAIALPDSPP